MARVETMPARKFTQKSVGRTTRIFTSKMKSEHTAVFYLCLLCSSLSSAQVTFPQMIPLGQGYNLSNLHIFMSPGTYQFALYRSYCFEYGKFWSSLERGKNLQHFLLDRVAKFTSLRRQQGQPLSRNTPPPSPPTQIPVKCPPDHGTTQ